MTEPKRRALKDDEGAVLLVALLVLLVFSLIIGAVLGQAGVGQKSTPVVRAHLSKVYAADAGIDAGIARLRRDTQYCATKTNPAVAQTLPGLADGRDVTVNCSVLSSGSTAGAAGYAVVLTSNAADSLSTALGADKTITGPVFLSGDMDNQQVVAVKQGDLDHLCPASGGTTTAPSSTEMTFDNGYGYAPVCRTEPVVDHKLPSVGNCGSCNPVISDTDSACSVFTPGRYTSAPALDSSRINYFASGVYYLDNVGAWAIKQAIVIAGRSSSTTASCATAENDTQVGASGTGALFVLGGDSVIDFDADAHLEIFPRVDGTSATQSLSVVALKPGEPTQGYSTSSVTGDLFRPKNGNTPDFVVHGLLYAPAAKLTLNGTNTVRSQLLGGLVASKLRIEASSSATSLIIRVPVDGGQRRVKLTSSASASTFNGIADGGKDVTATVILDVANQANFPVQVRSWRTTAPDG